MALRQWWLTFKINNALKATLKFLIFYHSEVKIRISELELNEWSLPGMKNSEILFR